MLQSHSFPPTIPTSHPNPQGARVVAVLQRPMRSFERTTPLRAHFVLVPLMAQGHMVPMADLGLLLASHGTLVSIITTPVNAERFQPSINHASVNNHLPIRLVPLPFPSSETGLPPGCENLDLVQSLDNGKVLIHSLPVLEGPLRLFLGDRPPLPTCIISDFTHAWTRRVARDLRIRRYVFYSVCCFTLTCHRTLRPFYDGGGAPDSSTTFVVPGLEHHRIVVTRAQAPGFIPGDEAKKLRMDVEEADTTADGIIVNTFVEMEPMYVESYGRNVGRKLWPVGPVSLCHRENTSKAKRVWSSTLPEDKLLSWLNSKAPTSVVYLCFGSLANSSTEQLKEIGLGLEGSGSPFIWVIRRHHLKIDTWLEDGFEERNQGRALVIRGWAPQALILGHPSVGAFVTHCGWNSCVEGIATGLPFVTWPFFADQFLNERMLVDVLGIAVPVGVREPNMWWSEDEVEVVGRTKVEVAVRRVMESREEAEQRRRWAQELGVKARKAMREGGSSHGNLMALIEEVVQLGNEGNMGQDDLKEKNLR